MSPAVLIGISAIGALGLYLLMPGARLSFKAGAVVLLLAAAAGLLAEAGRMLPTLGYQIPFGVFAFIGLLGAVRVISGKQPVYNALFFILVVICVTGLLVLMNAEFLAMGLLAIYAGAILVTYVFVIMLAQQGGTAAYDHTAREPFMGVVAGFLLLAAIAGALLSGPVPAAAAGELVEAGRGTVRNVGVELLTTYVVGIQLSGVLLLAAMVGAIAIARRKAVVDSPMALEVD